MKIDFENPKTMRKIGIAAIILSLVLGFFLLLHYVLTDDDKELNRQVSSESESQMLNQAKRDALLADLTNEANGDTDIEPEKAKEIMGLNVKISDEICRMYLNNDMETLTKEMEDYLVSYDFYMDVTKAVCTEIITMDYKDDIAYLEFKLDDPARTVLTLEYMNGTYRFNFR